MLTATQAVVRDVSGRIEGGRNFPAPIAFDALVLDACLRQSLVTVRALGRRGLAVAALETVDNIPTFSSRWCRHGFVCRADEATEAYLDYLEQVLAHAGVRVLIPSADGTIALLRRHRARLERRVRIALAEEPALTIAINKAQTLAVAKRLGINIPRGLVVRAVREVPAALQEIGLPAVVKPTESWLWGAQRGARVDARLVITPDEARRAVAELTRFGGVVLFQELLSGRREAVSFLYAHGEIYARFAQWAKRTRPPLGGESVLRQSIAVPPDIGELAERLVRELNLEGYAEVEFRRDSAGVPYLMEINPRLSASVEIAVRSGVDFPSLLYQWASGGPIDRVERYRIDNWMRYLHGDIMTTVAAIQQRGRPGVTPPLRAILDFGLSFFRPMGYDYVDWKDPLPVVKATTDSARYLVGAVMRGKLSRLRTFKEDCLVSVSSEMDASRRSVPAAQYDAVVVGAGPYGLSTAAHLIGRGLKVAVFGKTLELWRDHMPTGMLLRSHWWATNLSDPRRQYGLERFFEESRYEKRYPVPIEIFIDYARWFQKRAVPNVDETYVSSIERQNEHFLLTLEDGRTVRSAAVVMATGLSYYAHRPEPYTRLPAGWVSHSCDHRDLACFKGRTIVVIGGGQSAMEFAALLHEAGATVHVVSRRPIVWLSPDRTSARTIVERILAPSTSLAPGWTNWILEKMPYFFYHLPRQRKDRALRNSYMLAAASDWLRDRVIGKTTLHEGRTVVGMEVADGKVDVTLSDGKKMRADHVLLATGYKVDINTLTMIHPSLLAEIKTEMSVPILSRWFESSVRGLYFVGLTSLRAFGPLYRFVAGCGVTARRVASAVARHKAAGSPSRQSLRPSRYGMAGAVGEGQGKVKIETIEDLAGFMALEDEWNELLQASAADCVFLTWEWLSTWWRHLSQGRRLRIMTVREGRELIAIAPLAVRPPKLTSVRPFRAVEFLGSGIIGSDYLDFILRSGKEQVACRALAASLSREKLMLEFTQLRRKSCQAAEVATQLGRCGWSLSAAQTNVCPFITLSEHSWPSYLATLGPAHRQNFERRIKNLTKQFDFRFGCVGSEAQRREALGHLVALHGLRWKDRGVSEAFFSPALLAFHEEMSRLALERGWLRLFVLWLDGQPAASLYGFRYGRAFYFFQSGFDPRYARHSVGLVTMGLTIKQAIEEGVQEYDLLHGAEPYKFRWARETRELGRLELYPPGGCGRFYRVAMGLSRSSRRLARLVLPGKMKEWLALRGQLGRDGGHHAA